MKTVMRMMTQWNSDTTEEIGENAVTVLPFLLQQKFVKSTDKDFIKFIPEDANVQQLVESSTNSSPHVTVKGKINKAPQILSSSYSTFFTVYEASKKTFTVFWTWH